MAEYTIKIDNWHPTPLNKLLGHWAAASRRKQADRQMIGFYASQAKVKPAEGKRQVEIAITLGKGQRACDPDSYFKSTLDALVALNYLKDDSRQQLELSPVRFERAEQPATTIKLTDIIDCPPGHAEGSIYPYTAKSKSKAIIKDQ